LLTHLGLDTCRDEASSSTLPERYFCNPPSMQPLVLSLQNQSSRAIFV
jgi:hypothetical protein